MIPSEFATISCRVGALVCALAVILAASAYISASEVKTEVDLPPDLMTRYETLIAELRCPKCLNINIADSNAPVAAQLRGVVAEQLQAGKTDDEIKDFLRDRYGAFIDYDPPLSPATLALWVLPIALLLCAALVFTFVGFRRQKVELSDAERVRLQRFKDQARS